ncbi:MAG: hypothetical protein K2W96_12030 [Gemmataceae bacterium]|nr:hypothetical protein [Gemmataceae bacterium]
MIQGTVNANLIPVLRIKVYGVAGIHADLDATPDTGYTGHLTAPPAVVSLLGLKKMNRGFAILADGTRVEFDNFAGEIDWDGSRRAIIVSATGSEVLLGMKLMQGYELRLEVDVGGKVELRPLPPKPAAVVSIPPAP